MSVTQYEGELRLTAALGGNAYQGPASYWAELVTDTPSRLIDGTPSGLNRIEVVCATDVTNNFDGTGDNATVWAWAAPATDLPECSYLELWDDQWGGNRRFFEMLSDPITPLADLAVTVPVGNFTWTEV